jgi:hypothetical protein
MQVLLLLCCLGTILTALLFSCQSHSLGAATRHQWRCLPGLRSSLGFDEIPESPPTVRGGDTSLFSLPESEHDATPHTSNVSLTTTITSAWSPEKQPSSRRNEGSHLRRTVEAAATLFDRLSAACSKLVQISAPSDTSIRAAEEIKRIYLQLITIHPNDMKALIDSFQLDLPPLQISRMVSDDYDEQRADRRQSSSLALPPPVPLTRSSGTLIRNPAQEIVARSLGIRFEAAEVNLIPEEEEGHNLFSPTTVDMKSIEESRDEDEDVRRAVGSFDREDNEERDGPPAGEREPIATKRDKRSNWFRIRAHKTKMAE